MNFTAKEMYDEYINNASPFEAPLDFISYHTSYNTKYTFGFVLCLAQVAWLQEWWYGSPDK